MREPINDDEAADCEAVRGIAGGGGGGSAPMARRNVRLIELKGPFALFLRSIIAELATSGTLLSSSARRGGSDVRARVAAAIRSASALKRSAAAIFRYYSVFINILIKLTPVKSFK